ncbi:glucuronosyltransferase [Sphingobium sp. SCG-1]|uniref:glucuronosyltransferase n=1 Tax=Sphingobium sp. SCG-1 TaxID=2072936 RepID=UPI000CD69C36|nr:glucuronosyltransferase [Sphingobium sp. SCG-1]AUW59847.1 glucuronosyltransferase [Sphingobium sp. SCG-1]
MDGLLDQSVKVLAVASGGGHWEQLMLLRSALDKFDVIYGTTTVGLAERDGLGDVVYLPDCNRSSINQAIKCLIECWRLVRKTRPNVVITTGALPGLFCLVIGRVNGARTVWIDSLANFEKPSMSGQFARYFSTLWLTQWENLARPKGPHYYGGLF